MPDMGLRSFEEGSVDFGDFALDSASEAKEGSVDFGVAGIYSGRDSPASPLGGARPPCPTWGSGVSRRAQ